MKIRNFYEFECKVFYVESLFYGLTEFQRLIIKTDEANWTKKNRYQRRLDAKSDSLGIVQEFNI